MTDPLHEIAAQARRLADHYRSMSEKPPAVERTAKALCGEAAADFDRIVRACERASSGSWLQDEPSTMTISLPGSRCRRLRDGVWEHTTDGGETWIAGAGPEWP